MSTLFTLMVLGALAAAAYLAYRAYTEESKEARTVRSLPPSVQHVIAQMDGLSQSAFFNEYEAKKRKKYIGYLAWFFLGWQYLYTSKVGLQFAYWFTFGGFGLWALADLFRMPAIIRSANERVAREALQTLHLGAAFVGTALPPHLVRRELPASPGEDTLDRPVA